MSFTQSDLITMLHQVNNPMLYKEYINLCFFYSVLSYASPCELSLASPKVNYPMHASPNVMFPKINYHVLHPVINPMLQQQNLNYSMLHSTVSMHDILIRALPYASILLLFY